MRLYAIYHLPRREAGAATSASSHRPDRCPREASQTLPASVARGHLRNWASRGGPAPCGARKPMRSIHRKSKSSCGLFACWRRETNGLQTAPICLLFIKLWFSLSVHRVSSPPAWRFVAVPVQHKDTRFSGWNDSQLLCLHVASY